MSNWQSVGHHRFRYQDEVLYFEPHGELSLSQAETWSFVIASHFQQQRHGFLIVDARELKPPPAGVRRMFVSWWRDCQPRPRVIIFGANLLMRTVSRLVLAATRQLYQLELDLTLYATEAEAWAHIDRVRPRSLPTP
jgi:hypothetical protein